MNWKKRKGKVFTIVLAVLDSDLGGLVGVTGSGFQSGGIYKALLVRAGTRAT